MKYQGADEAKKQENLGQKQAYLFWILWTIFGGLDMYYYFWLQRGHIKIQEFTRDTD